MGFSDKNTVVGCLFLLQGTFSIQRSNPCLLHWQADSLPLSPIQWLLSILTVLRIRPLGLIYNSLQVWTLKQPLSHPSIPQPFVTAILFAVFISLDFFLTSTYKWYYAVFVFLCLIYLTKHMFSGSIHVVARFPTFSRLSKIPLSTYSTH